MSALKLGLKTVLFAAVAVSGAGYAIYHHAVGSDKAKRRNLVKYICNKYRNNKSIVYPDNMEIRLCRQNRLDFKIILMKSLMKKPTNIGGGAKKVGFDPFAPPYNEDLFCGETRGGHHVMVLNKFPISTFHVLIATKEMKIQGEPLDLNDLEAAIDLMLGVDGVVVYNGGPNAGATQRHKHFQVIQRNDSYSAPVLDYLDHWIDSEGERNLETNEMIHLEGWNFAHGIRLIPRDWSSKSLEEIAVDYLILYNQMKESLIERDPARGDHALIFTRRYIILIPRRTNAFEGINFNSFPFMGTLTVASQNEYKLIIESTPLRVLQELCYGIPNASKVHAKHGILI